MNREELERAANARGFGTGQALRDRLAAEAECRALLPDRGDVPAMTAAADNGRMPNGPVLYCGYSSEAGEDWNVYAEDGWRDTDTMAIGDDAKTDAQIIAAIINAYRLGILQIDNGEAKT
ncbi:MAG TPA: hypothetical protein PKA07_11345 [Micropruina sp.]|nr:hypothetical protein [Micropruina sp.]